jgi:hypothetical protein
MNKAVALLAFKSRMGFDHRSSHTLQVTPYIISHVGVVLCVYIEAGSVYFQPYTIQYILIYNFLSLASPATQYVGHRLFLLKIYNSGLLHNYRLLILV